MIQLLDLYYIILDYAAPDIHVPIAILLIQILDVIFHSIQKSHYTSSSFWMPGRNFTTVLTSQIHASSMKLNLFFFIVFILPLLHSCHDENAEEEEGKQKNLESKFLFGIHFITSQI